MQFGLFKKEKAWSLDSLKRNYFQIKQIKVNIFPKSIFQKNPSQVDNYAPTLSPIQFIFFFCSEISLQNNCVEAPPLSTTQKVDTSKKKNSFHFLVLVSSRQKMALQRIKENHILCHTRFFPGLSRMYLGLLRRVFSYITCEIYISIFEFCIFVFLCFNKLYFCALLDYL